MYVVFTVVTIMVIPRQDWKQDLNQPFFFLFFFNKNQ